MPCQRSINDGRHVVVVNNVVDNRQLSAVEFETDTMDIHAVDTRVTSVAVEHE